MKIYYIILLILIFGNELITALNEGRDAGTEAVNNRLGDAEQDDLEDNEVHFFGSHSTDKQLVSQMKKSLARMATKMIDISPPESNSSQQIEAEIVYTLREVHISELDNAEPYLIRCSETGPNIAKTTSDKFAWTNWRGEDVESRTEGRVSDDDDGNLVLVNAIASDSGLYICAGMKFKHLVHVHVHIPADFAFFFPFSFAVQNCSEFSNLDLFIKVKRAFAEGPDAERYVFQYSCSDQNQELLVHISSSDFQTDRMNDYSVCQYKIKCLLNLNLASALTRFNADYTAVKAFIQKLIDMGNPTTNNVFKGVYPAFVCPSGYANYKNIYCVLCHPGTFSNHNGFMTSSCNECDRGSFQELAGQTECIACDTNYTTEFTSADSFEDCVLNKKYDKDYSVSVFQFVESEEELFLAFLKSYFGSYMLLIFSVFCLIACILIFLLYYSETLIPNLYTIPDEPYRTMAENYVKTSRLLDALEIINHASGFFLAIYATIILCVFGILAYIASLV